MCRNNVTAVERMHLTSIYVLQNYWRSVASGVKARYGTLDEYLAAIGVFDVLLGDYEDSVRRIFEQYPKEPDLQALLTPDAKRTLETFRERFVSFRGDYEEFEQSLSRSLRTKPVHPRYFSRPGPLTA